MAHTRWQIFLLFLSFLALSLAASPTSFCKCTCFNKNSTIIPLDAPDTTSPPLQDDDSDDGDPPSARLNPSRRTCNDCNKQFCLSNNLPICKNAEEDDVFTTCFQRDSTKDQLVVYIFILATGGLLTWAAIRPWWEKWRDLGRTGGGGGDGARAGAYAHVQSQESRR